MEHLDHPSPHFNDAKMARFLLLTAFIIAFGEEGGGGGGLIVPFYSVQDCPRTTLSLQEAMFAMQNTSDLLSHVR